MNFRVEVYENGVVVIPEEGLFTNKARVFESAHLEEALLEMYRMCGEWNVGDRVEIKKAGKPCPSS